MLSPAHFPEVHTPVDPRLASGVASVYTPGPTSVHTQETSAHPLVPPLDASPEAVSDQLRFGAKCGRTRNAYQSIRRDAAVNWVTSGPDSRNAAAAAEAQASAVASPRLLPQPRFGKRVFDWYVLLTFSFIFFLSQRFSPSPPPQPDAIGTSS